MSDSRFEDLLGRFLDGALTAQERDDLTQLVREDPDRLDDLRAQLEASELLAMAGNERRQIDHFLDAIGTRLAEPSRHDINATTPAFSTNGHHTRPEAPTQSPRTRRRSRRGLWAMAAIAAVVLLVAGLVLSLGGPSREDRIARITERNGSLLWIGDGGRLSDDLEVGDWIGGCTLETLSDDSWITLEFRDGSILTISGPTLLTISEDIQKQLHLREGNLFAQVAPQAPDKPMRIHTRTAELEVLGTQLNVDAESSLTRLRVDEGRVRLTRLVDGRVVEVPAQHQVTAKADRLEPLTSTRRLEAVDRWESDLRSSMGKWLPPKNEIPARLLALPIVFNRPDEGPVAIFVASFDVARCGCPPVRLVEGATFQVLGRIGSLEDVHLGLTMTRPEGGFGGKFETIVKADDLTIRDGTFEIEIPLDAFWPRYPKISQSPIGLELEDCYVFTVDVEATLEVTRVELLPPAEAESTDRANEPDTTAQPS